MNRYTSQSDFESSSGKFRTLTFNFWLSLYPDGDMKMTRGEPAIDRLGRKMKMELVVPIAVFETPELKATITVSASDVTLDIDAFAAAEALRKALGVDIDVRVVQPSVGGDQ